MKEIQNNVKIFCLIIATVLLAGCATPRMNTVSGRPEVTINATLARVRSELSSAFMNRGYTITRADDLQIEARKDAGMAASIFLATAADPSAVKIARVNLAELPGGVRVVLRAFIVAGGRDQGEITGKLQESQAWLDEVKRAAESK